MVLTDLAVGRSSRGIEVAQRRPPQPVAVSVPAQDLLDHQLRLAVRIHRRLRMTLVDRHAHGIAVGRAGRGEDDRLDASVMHRVQQVQRSNGVVLEVLRWIGHGLADERIRREVHDRVDLPRCEDLRQPSRIGQISALEWPPLDRPLMTLAQVVENHGLVPRRGEVFCRVAADVSGPTCY